MAGIASRIGNSSLSSHTKFTTDNLNTERLRMVTQDSLKKLLKYDTETGIFVWLADQGNGRPSAGEVAGYNRVDGYIDISINGRRYMAHALAFLYVYGYIPENQIDHKFGNRSDNRIEFLKEVSSSCNAQNTKKQSNNTSGFPGVCFHNQCAKWLASSTVNRKQKSLGLYESKLEAALARLTWEMNCEHWKCNHRGELVKAIKSVWPRFNERCVC